MCGIAGFWSRGGEFGQWEPAIRQMCGAIEHRGPDAEGVWAEEPSGVVLGHRRLSIVDLSPSGSQPMHSPSGRYVISFNGEIYNFRDLRRELESRFSFRGSSDTEVMLAAIEAWGLDAAVARFNGMFAFAVWDRTERALHLVRDRMGVKPLYYGWSNGVFFFGSQLASFRAHPRFSPAVDPDALALYLRYRYVPAPYSIYRGIRKQPPGTIVTLGDPRMEQPDVRTFWSLSDVVEAGHRDPFAGSEEEAGDALDRLLRDAVGIRMVADVPLGAFLSGGVDSSLVVALMQAQSDRPVKTFSIGFDNASYNEADYAHAVASHLHTDHEELVVTAKQALEVIPKLPTFFDEPFADSSQIPTHLVSALARPRVTVALSGDGGDELFGGYNRHVWGRTVSRMLRSVPAGVRRSSGRMLSSVSADAWERMLTPLGWIAPRAFNHRMLGYKVHKLSEILSADSEAEFYRHTVSLWKDPTSVVRGAVERPTLLTQAMSRTELMSRPGWMMYLDMTAYLPDDIMVKVDRASMAVGLEAREPLLDYRLVEFAWRIPEHMKLRDHQGKWLLREVLYRYVPKKLIDRPKSGFGVPLGDWLRGPLREWAEELLSERRLHESGYFNPAPIRQKWAEHLQNRGSWQYHLWTILMFQAWLEKETSGADMPALQAHV